MLYLLDAGLERRPGLVEAPLHVGVEGVEPGLSLLLEGQGVLRGSEAPDWRACGRCSTMGRRHTSPSRRNAQA